MGVDGNGDCVYWRADEISSPHPRESAASPSPPSHAQTASGVVQAKASVSHHWELLNDGTCERTSSAERATAQTEEACLSSVQSWSCIENIPDAAFAGTQFCTHTGLLHGASLLNACSIRNAAELPQYFHEGVIRQVPHIACPEQLADRTPQCVKARWIVKAPSQPLVWESRCEASPLWMSARKAALQNRVGASARSISSGGLRCSCQNS